MDQRDDQVRIVKTPPPPPLLSLVAAGRKKKIRKKNMGAGTITRRAAFAQVEYSAHYRFTYSW